MTDPSRLILLGCVKSKASHAASAAELYVSPLWEKRRAYATRAGLRWQILSAEHGLVDPCQLLEPYDTTIASLPPAEREAWGAAVVAGLQERYGDLAGIEIEVHAGAQYVKAVKPALEAAGARVEHPLAGMGIGEQLRWYAVRARD